MPEFLIRDGTYPRAMVKGMANHGYHDDLFGEKTGLRFSRKSMQHRQKVPARKGLGLWE